MIVRELFALLGFDVDEQSLLRAENAFEAIAKTAFKLELSLSRVGSIGTAAMQELEYAAKQNGISSDELTMRFGYLSRAVAEAVHTGGAAGAAFYRLGMSTADLIDGRGQIRDLPSITLQISKHLAAMKDQTQASAIAMELFGRNSATMLPFLKQGPDGIKKWADEAHRTGGIMSEDLVKSGEKLYHTLIMMDMTFKGLIYATLGPFVERVNAIVQSMATWIQTNRALIAYRIDNVINAIGMAFQFAAYAATNFTKSFAVVGMAVFAAMFPLTAAFASIFLIAEDLYHYFDHNDRRSITYLMILGFEAIGKVITDTFSSMNPFTGIMTGLENLWKSLDASDLKTGLYNIFVNPFIWAYDKAKILFDYLGDRLKDPAFAALSGAAIGAVTAGPFGAVAGGLAGLGIGTMTPASGLGQWLSPNPNSGPSAVFNLAVNAASNAPADIASAIRQAIDQWWYEQMSRNSAR